MRRWVVALALALISAASAAASPAAPASPAACPTARGAVGFAPTVLIRRVDVRGNTITSGALIRRALAVAAGDCLAADDRRLRDARYKVLALGFFREVELRFEKADRRGEVVLVVEVVERGTLVLNRIFLGTSTVTPFWSGLDGGDRNLGGLGLGGSAAFVWAAAGEHVGARDQRAFALRLDDGAIGGGPFGWRASAHWVEASEPYRVAGPPASQAIEDLAAFDLRRVGGRGGLGWSVTPLTRLTLDLRFESVTADLPSAPPIELLLEDGHSRVATVAVGLERDTRPDPVLPYAGDHLALYAEVGVEPISSYGFASLLARYERWWRVAERHVVSAHAAAGAVLGDAPRFDRLYVGDLDRMLSPRPLGLVVSSTAPFDVFDTGADALSYGELGGVAEAQWAFRLFRSRGRLYGGDLFVGAGLWSLAARRALEVEGAGAIAVDLLVDAGLRLDSDVGIFELSLANALGRLPL
jgi:hypothetical protein